MRKALAQEFAAIYVVNLRGNQRTSGERSRQEGGKIFDSGSRATIAVTVLVKDSSRPGPATIHYTDVRDYLSREEKLAALAEAGGVLSLDRVVTIEPNAHGDWLNHCSDDFAAFAPASDAKSPGSIFGITGPGLLTGRDAWVYGYSQPLMRTDVQTTVATYGAAQQRLASTDLSKITARQVQDATMSDPTSISWTAGLKERLRRGRNLAYEPSHVRAATYRPFQKMHLYLDPALVERPGRAEARFPREADRRGIFLAGPSSSGGFGVLMVDRPSDLHLLGSGHVLDRWRFEAPDDEALDLAAVSDPSTRPGQIDNVTDAVLRRFRAAYGESFTKDDVFSYVYGLLHAPDYRERYAADLDKMLPRIPLVEDAAPYVDAGGRLAGLHLGYETQPPFPLAGLDIAGPGGGADHDFFRVEKMRFGRPTSEQKAAGQRHDRAVVYNPRITLSGVPEDAHRYMLGSRSAIEWIMDRYRVTTDKASGIVNDPNDWSREVADPRYVVDLLARIVTISVETMKIVDALPPLEIRSDQLNARF